jgi:phage terminase large subunit-like protein
MAGSGQLTWSFACPDWEARLEAGRSLVPDLPLFDDKAARAVNIFDHLRVPDIAGQPFFAEAAGDWFRDIVRAVFGSLDDDDVRHVPEVFCLVPKKNSKTTNGAALMLTALLVNKVPRAEFLLVAPTQEIADLAFQQAAGMIAADESGFLGGRFQDIEHKKTIRDRVTKAFVKIKTFDMKVMTGSKPVGVLIDELHIMGSMHFASRVIGQIRGALESKKNSFLLIITTQSDEPPAGAFRAELLYARKVRDGLVRNARLLPILYEFPRAMQVDRERPWADPRCWPMVTPNLGRSVHIEAMKAGFAAAQEKGEEELRRWASQHLNIEIGLALHSDGWAGANYWQDAADPALKSLDDLIARCEVAVVGIDGGGLDDLLGLCVIGREKGTRDWLAWSHAWAHRCVLERRKEIAPTLQDFERDGTLTIVGDDSDDDVQEVASIVLRLEEEGLLAQGKAIGADPVGITEITDALELAGFDTNPESAGCRVVGIAQGWTLSNMIKTAERRLAAKTLRHCGTRLMNWSVGNAKVEPRGNAIVITKQTSGWAKIDPLMAHFDAVALMTRNPEAPAPSPWDDPNFSLMAAP